MPNSRPDNAVPRLTSAGGGGENDGDAESEIDGLRGGTKIGLGISTGGGFGLVINGGIACV